MYSIEQIDNTLQELRKRYPISSPAIREYLTARAKLLKEIRERLIKTAENSETDIV